MSSVSKDDHDRKVINKMKETPSVGRYKPKYEFVDKRSSAFVYREEHKTKRRVASIQHEYFQHFLRHPYGYRYRASKTSQGFRNKRVTMYSNMQTLKPAEKKTYSPRAKVRKIKEVKSFIES